MSFAYEDPLGAALGPKVAATLKRAFGMATVADLLRHYPRRYATRGELTPIQDLPVGENVTIVAQVIRVLPRRIRARAGDILEVIIGDGMGQISVTFFNQAWRASELRPGRRGIFSGKVGVFKNALQLSHPQYELFAEETEIGTAFEAAWHTVSTPIPIYPATGSLPSWKIAQLVNLALAGVQDVPDPFSEELRVQWGLLTAPTALKQVHVPESVDEIAPALTTLRAHEALVMQTALVQQRLALRQTSTTAWQAKPGGLLEQFDANLAFTRTKDQVLVGEQISQELQAAHPMNRMIQGEVGSGKTLVALRAMLQVAQWQGQSALIAPTEVLATQHLRSITKLLGPELSAEIRPVLITGSLSAAERRKVALAAASGQALIVVGTHALLTDKTVFAQLGLIVVDEQHRFGVEQREKLRAKGLNPHVLVLTATPIPRTVAMTVFGDLDISTIRTLPSGRAETQTFVVPLAETPGWLPRVWDRAAEEVEKGHQVYLVAPAIDTADVKAATATLRAARSDELTDASADSFANAHSVTQQDQQVPQPGQQDGPPAGRPGGPGREPLWTVAALEQTLASHPRLSGLRRAVLHGRMSSADKDQVMQDFAAGKIDLLVATTVIEVGVDVANASTMIIFDADRFGVSQLHQLRGRVGRGSVPGLCLLVTTAEMGTSARERVEAVKQGQDGFELAEIDLRLRGEGDVLGDMQAGSRSSLRLLRVVEDADLIARARKVAEHILDLDRQLITYPGLARALSDRLSEQQRAALSKN